MGSYIFEDVYDKIKKVLDERERRKTNADLIAEIEHYYQTFANDLKEE